MNENKKVYLVWDTNNDEIVSVNATKIGARRALLKFLREDTGYTTEEWEQFADDNGFDTVEEFQINILQWNDWDEEMQMMVEEMEVGE